MILDEVCSRTKFHPTYFDAEVWIFHVELVWWGVSSNIPKFSQIPNVCTFELQFEFGLLDIAAFKYAPHFDSVLEQGRSI